LAFGFRWPDAVDAALLFSAAVFNVIGHISGPGRCFMAPATAVSPFYYLMLVWRW